jgi:hypothetical protein
MSPPMGRGDVLNDGFQRRQRLVPCRVQEHNPDEVAAAIDVLAKEAKVESDVERNEAQSNERDRRQACPCGRYGSGPTAMPTD